MNKEFKSQFGILRSKLNNSGINGNPIITDKELKTLNDLCGEYIKLCEDIEDSPLKYYFQTEKQTVQSIIYARQPEFDK